MASRCSLPGRRQSFKTTTKLDWFRQASPAIFITFRLSVIYGGVRVAELRNTTRVSAFPEAFNAPSHGFRKREEAAEGAEGTSELTVPSPLPYCYGIMAYARRNLLSTTISPNGENKQGGINWILWQRPLFATSNELSELVFREAR